MKLLINEKEYGLSWGMGAIRRYCAIMDCDIDGLDKAILSDREVDRQFAITVLIFSALQNWCAIEDVEFNLSIPKLEDWLSNTDQKTFDAIMRSWKDSKYFDKTIGQYYFGEGPAEQTELQAKTSKKKSRPSVKS
jgi:hypothetical protein